MRILFLGTPDFAIPSLDILISNNYEIAGVVTTTDKEQGRGLRTEFSPLKKYATGKELKIYQPENLKDENFLAELRKLEIDLGIVVAFKILSKSLYSIPKLGTFNLHGSLLPKYRGAAPIQWSLINGDEKTGLTTFFLEDKVDTGNIILQREVFIDKNDNFETLHDKMSEAGANLVLETVKLIEKKNYQLIKQDNSLSTAAPKITKDISNINWDKSALSIHNLIRGLSPFPCAFSKIDNKIFKIFKTEITSFFSNGNFGKIEISDGKMLVNTNDFKLSILEIQQEGKKKLKTEEFLKGFRMTEEKIKFTNK